MGITELAKYLACSKGNVSQLVRKGMPVNSVEAAQAWRNAHAKPRSPKGSGGAPPPQVIEMKPRPPVDIQLPTAKKPKAEKKPAPAPVPMYSDSEPDDEDNTPRQSLRRARLAEKVGYNELVTAKKLGGSVEDIRKANSIYIASRNNRISAEKDFRAWQRDERITLFTDEAHDLIARPHLAVKDMLAVMPKTLAPRLLGQGLVGIEKALGDWADKLMAQIRASI